MRYATARYNEHRRDAVYRIYVSDCLRIITKAHIKGDIARYADMISPKKPDTRSGDEIAADIINLAGLEVIE